MVLLFQTGCGMVVTTAYPKTAFKAPYVHNLFQNGACLLYTSYEEQTMESVFGSLIIQAIGIRCV